MNKLQQFELKMTKLVMAFFDEHPELLALSVMLKNVRDAIADHLTMVEAHSLLQMNNLKGITTAKTNTRQVIERQIRQIAGALSGYFSYHNMPPQEQQAREAATYPAGRTETELYKVAEIVYNLAMTVQTELPTMNLTLEQVNLLQANGKTFETMISGRQLSESERTASTAGIDELLGLIMFKFSHQADQLMKAFDATHPDLFAQYERLRRVEQPYRRRKANGESPDTAAITFRFVDSVSFAPVEGVTLEENGKLTDDSSDEEGEVYREEVPAGINNYRFIGPAHKARIFATPALEAGKKYSFEIELEAGA
jgi:hypothetical protein